MRGYFAAKGHVYHSGSGGTYRVNDGDPQNDDDEAPTAEECEPDWDTIRDRREER